MKILHVLNHSIPHTDGYCIRSENIVRFQKDMGWRPVVITSPCQEPRPTLPKEIINGVPYYRVVNPNSIQIPYIRQVRTIKQLRDRLHEVVSLESPNVIHAHSPSLCGIAALSVAKKHKIPFVYELRAFWEDEIFDRGKDPRWSLRYKVSRRLEEKVIRSADAIATISKNMQDDLISRGFDKRRLFVTPNGVECDRFSEEPADTEMQNRLGLTGKTVFGYIGSLYRWEGVDTLVRAMRQIVAQAPQCKLVIVGGGEQQAMLSRLVDTLGLQDNVLVLGRVPHQEVSKYYSVMDALIYPRKRSRTTELVTPLKPLEAQAMGKPILNSDVGGLAELSSGYGALQFRSEDESDIAVKCLEFIALTPDARRRLGMQGQTHVQETRDWKRVIQCYKPVYEFALDAHEHHAFNDS